MKFLISLNLISFLFCFNLNNENEVNKLINELYLKNKHERFQNSYSLYSSILKTNNSKLYSNILFFNRVEDLQKSFGNYLSDYIETRICANLTNLHFYSPIHKNNSYIREYFPLPRFIYHPNSSSIHKIGIKQMKKICPCDRNCHEYSNSLLFNYPIHTKDILLPLINSISRNFSNYLPITSPNIWRKTIKNSFYFNEISKTFQHQQEDNHHQNFSTFIPSISDALIHYRCSDNVRHKKMGLLSFKQFNELIPKNVKYIYIITEPLFRTAILWANSSNACDPILNYLHIYLSSKYSSSTVIILRGEPLLHDIYRIYSSKIIFCSPSTFCYYPSLLSPYSTYYHQNYFPSPLVSAPPKVYTPFTGLIRILELLAPNQQENISELTRSFHSHFHNLGNGSSCEGYVLLPRLVNRGDAIKCLMNYCIC